MELPPEVLACRATLPRKPAPVVLTGSIVELRPLVLDTDLDALFAVASGAACAIAGRTCAAYDPDAQIWRWMSGGPFATTDALRAWLAPQVAAADGLAMTVRVASAPVGVANFLASHPEHLKVELGSIWYGPIAQGTGMSREVTQLLLEHVFALGYRRAEWKCDARNEASRRAAVSYGFTFEGVQDAHYIIKGRSRDTAWYRMLDHEWAALRPTM